MSCGDEPAASNNARYRYRFFTNVRPGENGGVAHTSSHSYACGIVPGEKVIDKSVVDRVVEAVPAVPEPAPPVNATVGTEV